MVSDRLCLFDNEDYVLELEYNVDFAIFHLAAVHRFTPRVLRRMKQHFNDLRTFLELHYPAVHTTVRHEDTHLHKLVARMGMRPLGEDGEFVIYTTEE